ncbi:hypothetical protein Tco_0989521 [Tanacetum coccineum]|uniref:Uncharacterized protein n=1 Tax=Tanacetum coccineum TaxID=301880 RepID=A0ABQ5EU90_9ASTR
MIHEDGDNDTNGEFGVNVEEEDGEWIRFLGGNSSSGIKKYRGSNSNDGGNTGDGVKITGGVIGSGDEIGSYGSKGLLPYGFEKEEMWCVVYEREQPGTLFLLRWRHGTTIA